MNSFVILVAAIIAMATAAPQHPEQPPAQILRQESDVHPEGYRFIYETSDGTARQEQGVLKEFDENHRAIEVTGNYKYVAPDGLTYIVTFIANEHGYQPQERVEQPGQDQRAFPPNQQ